MSKVFIVLKPETQGVGYDVCGVYRTLVRAKEAAEKVDSIEGMRIAEAELDKLLNIGLCPMYRFEDVTVSRWVRGQ